MSYLDEILANCPTIADDVNYWFVRTEGGSLYEAFLASRSIALGYSKFGLKAIEAVKEEKHLDELKGLVQKFYPDIAQPGFAANQVWRFCRVMKKGDFVICPSHGTAKLLLGTINDTAPFEEELTVNDKTYPDFKLRRKVNWVRTVTRDEVNPKLLGLLMTHQAIVSANAYAVWIDPLFYEFFRKNGAVHYVMEVGTEEHISARTLFGACEGLLNITDEIAEAEDLPQDTAPIDTRINLNSPGVIEFICANPGVSVATLALLVHLLIGGGVKINIPGKFNLTQGASEGLIFRITQYLNARSDRKMKNQLTEKLKTLDVKESEQFVEILNSIDDLRKKGKK